VRGNSVQVRERLRGAPPAGPVCAAHGNE